MPKSSGKLYRSHIAASLIKIVEISWLPSLKLTYIAPENGWLEDKPFLLGPGFLVGVNSLLVSGSVPVDSNGFTVSPFHHLLKATPGQKPTQQCIESS